MIYIIDRRIIDSVESLKDYAQKNIWSLDKLLLQKRGKQGPPGDEPEYTRLLWDTIKIVFTHTEQPIGLTRHLSVSTSSDGDQIPHPVVVQEIMQMLGFSGSIKSCNVFQESLQGGGEAINLIEKID